MQSSSNLVDWTEIPGTENCITNQMNCISIPFTNIPENHKFFRVSYKKND